jgi:predicted cupin superfamily sugar epimerase
MMDTASHNLTAQRSWHFYDEAIIALATNLTLKTRTTTWTTLASRLLSTGKITVGFFNSTVITLSDGNYSFPYIQSKTSNVQWIHVGQSNIAYLLQSQGKYASLGIDIRMKAGNYIDFGPYNSTVTA